MASEQRLEEIKRRWREIIPQVTDKAKQPMNGEASWVCPFCGHGNHGDGLTFVPEGRGQSDGNVLKCFSCDFTGDILSILRKKYNYTLPEAVTEAEKLLKLPPEISRNTSAGPQERTAAVSSTHTTPAAESAQTALKRQTERIAENKAYLEKSRAQLADETTGLLCRTYLTGRGIPISLALEYGCGYDPNHSGTGRSLIIPSGESGYVARSIELEGGKFLRYKNAPGESGIFNADELKKPGPVFVCEGAIDALSIIAAGGRAIGLNSISGKNKLLEQAATERPKAFLILTLDQNDEKGQQAEGELADQLREMGIEFTRANLCGDDVDVDGNPLKDPNDVLCYAEDHLKERMKAAAAEWNPRPDNTESYIDQLMEKEIFAFTAAGERKTGFEILDAKAGGIYNGLYVLAAASSVGKTTFCLQMADQLAAQEQDVIYFSMEQSKLEMVAKSLARFTAQDDMKTAVNSLSIRKGNKTAPVQRAVARYKQKVGNRVSIIEGDFMQSVEDIQKKVREYISQTGKHPVVFIDYLQLLQPDEDKQRQTTKEVVDNAVTQLKRMSRSLEVPVFAISSINRKSYYYPINLESLKESGGVEYTADVVWGLQFQCVHEKDFTSSENVTNTKRERIKMEKRKPTRKVEITCVKNRYGVADFTCKFDYNPANELFTTSV